MLGLQQYSAHNLIDKYLEFSSWWGQVGVQAGITSLLLSLRKFPRFVITA